MADCFGAPHFLTIIFAVLLISEKVFSVDDNTFNAAKGKKVFTSSTASNGDASLAVDGDTTTCSRTDKGDNEYWFVDLGQEYDISKLNINVGDAGVSLTVKVGNDDQNQQNGLCFYLTPNSDGVTESKGCYSAMRGQFVYIENDRGSAITLCEVEVPVCKDGFFGKDCAKTCHCKDNEICSKDTGECPNGCGPGWEGEGCQNSCPTGTFGENCATECHCFNKAECDTTTGVCSNNKCEKNWLGKSCHVEIPKMEQDIKRLDMSSDWIVLGWDPWEGHLETGQHIKYRIEYKLYKYHGEGFTWERGPDIDKGGSGFVTAKVTDLNRNTYYVFKVTPYLVKKNGELLEGGTSPVSDPFRTECATPQPPEVTDIVGGVYYGTEDPTAMLSIRWKKYDKNLSGCDDIKIFHILTKKAGQSKRDNTGGWKRTLASRTAESRNVTGLEFGAKYEVQILAINNKDIQSEGEIMEAETVAASTVIKAESAKASAAVTRPSNTNTLMIAGISIGVVVILAAVLLGVVYKRKKRKADYAMSPIMKDKEEATPLNSVKNHTNFDGVDSAGDHTVDNSPTNDVDSGMVDGSASEATPSSLTDTVESVDERSPPTKPEEPPNRLIRIEDLEKYIKERKQNKNEGLIKEYHELPSGLTCVHDVGKSPENKFKNRFINIIAYDHSRVILDEEEGAPASDYINANYIDGYNEPKAYVASQGCNKFTVQDMWRMVWQLKSHRIVMLTNLVENGKIKCEQYWPEKEQGPKLYADIEVTPMDVEETSESIVRTFLLSKDGETREVKHLQFLAWPDHGVPTRSSPLIAFRRKVRSYDRSHPGIPIIHCSAGVGRTGTYMAIDYELDKIKEEGLVNIFDLIKSMRKNRTLMIQTPEQYIFVYEALLEHYKTGERVIRCVDFLQEYADMCKIDEGKGKSRLKEEFEILQSMTPVQSDNNCQSGNLPENLEKNRCIKLLPPDRHRPYLMTRIVGTNDYINAVFLDGFRKRNSYIVTQMPLPTTVIDLWRMIYENNCSTVVMLNPMDEDDETYGQYWLEEEGCEVGPFVIEPVSEDSPTSDLTIRKLKYFYNTGNQTQNGESEKKEQERTIAQFQFKQWKKQGDVPNSQGSIMKLLDHVEKWQQEKQDGGPVIVHCHDGVQASGLYTALSIIWEKMKIDQEIDIFHTIKGLRHIRPQICQNVEQYKFCYDLVQAHLKEFATYSNLL